MLAPVPIHAIVRTTDIEVSSLELRLSKNLENLMEVSRLILDTTLIRHLTVAYIPSIVSAAEFSITDRRQQPRHALLMYDRMLVSLPFSSFLSLFQL